MIEGLKLVILISLPSIPLCQVPWDAVLKSVKEYNPVAMAMWAKGQPAPYLHVGRALAAMDSTTKRLRISDVIANMFRSMLALSPGASSSLPFLIP